ncbi:unnamed protein product [Phaeothamnion confervicola]
MYEVPDNDFCQYLIGAWKRNLEWRHFGGSFKHLRTSNSVVVIDEANDAAAEPGTRFLNWRFGRSTDEEELQLGFCMQLIPDAACTHLQWNYGGRMCQGIFHAGAAAASLNFRTDSGIITITYRAVDDNGKAQPVAAATFVSDRLTKSIKTQKGSPQACRALTLREVDAFYESTLV